MSHAYRPSSLAVLSLAALAVASSSAFAQAATASSPAQVTVYSGDFDAVALAGQSNAGYALVSRPLQVRAGELALTDLPRRIDPSTARLDGNGVRVQSQRYDLGNATPAAILASAIGREVRVALASSTDSQSHVGTLLSADNGVVIRDSDGEIRLIPNYASLSITGLPAELSATPTLRFLIDIPSERAARLQYATGGLAWQAAYRAELRSDARTCRLQLDAQATVANRSGFDFNDVALSLVASDANRRVQSMAGEERMMAAPASNMAKMSMADAEPERSASGDGHRYAVPGRVSLPDGSLQQVPLMPTATAVACERRYEAQRNDGDWLPDRPMVQRQIGGDGEVPVRSHLAFANTTANRLGLPLPAGRVLAFIDGELLGESEIAHTAAERRIDLDLGGAFDLSSSRKAVDFALDRSGRTLTETIEWTLRNGSDTAADITVLDRLPRWTAWELIEDAAAFRKDDAQRIRAVATVPASGETVLRYVVRYRWAEDITLD